MDTDRRDRRVVVTGLGTLAPTGLTTQAFWRALLNGEGGVDRIQAFDEIELAFPFTDDEELCLTITLEEGRMARILLSAARAGDDDADARGLSEEELRSALGRHGDTIAQLLERVTTPNQTGQG